MRIKILGTAAAEGIPAMFCNCDNCREARRLRGKNLRARAQTLIDDDLLVDFNADTYLNGQRFQIDLSAIKYFLITHTHRDHFTPFDFGCLGTGAAKNSTVEKVTLLGGPLVKTEFDRLTDGRKELFDSGRLSYRELTPFVTAKVGEYLVTPLEAVHGIEAYVYIIEKGGKKLFYCHDTGKLTEEDFAYMSKLDKPFNHVIMDCTYGETPADTYGGHMSLYDVENQIKIMRKAGAVTDETGVTVTHFSHWYIKSHERMEKLASELGFHAAYDGIEINV